LNCPTQEKGRRLNGGRTTLSDCLIGTPPERQIIFLAKGEDTLWRERGTSRKKTILKEEIRLKDGKGEGGGSSFICGLMRH
jgi:hypothetical protein